MKPIIYIDTDISLGTPGAEIDDGAALIMLLRNEQVQVAGIGSVFGNVPVADAALNLARILAYLDRNDIPTGLGAAEPFVEKMNWFHDWQSGYGKTQDFSFTNPVISSTQLLVDLVHTHPGQVCILSIGPMTNLALALQMAPDIEQNVKQVIAMGGSFSAKPQPAEFNVHCDPQAAATVFKAKWPLTLLGLEVTRQVVFLREEFNLLDDHHPAVKLLKNQAFGWIERVEKMGWEKGSCSLHDAVAAAYLLNKEIFSNHKATVALSLENGPDKGTTNIAPVIESDRCKVTIVNQVNVKECKELIWSYINQ